MDKSKARNAVIESQFRLMTAEEYDGIKAVIENELASFAREYSRSSNYLEQEDIEYFLLNMSKGKEKMKNKLKTKDSGLKYLIYRNEDEYGIAVKIMLPELLVTWTYRENTLSEQPTQKKNSWFCSVRVKREKSIVEQKAFLEEPNLNRVVPQNYDTNSQSTEEPDVDWETV